MVYMFMYIYISIFIYVGLFSKIPPKKPTKVTGTGGEVSETLRLE